MRRGQKHALFPTRTREVLLPKFKLEKDYDLVGALRALGVTALFDKHSNTTGITGQRIVIDLVTPALARPVWAGPPSPHPACRPWACSSSALGSPTWPRCTPQR